VLLAVVVWVLAGEYLVTQGKTLAPNVYSVPIGTDQWVACLKFDALGIGIDELTAEQ